jgi:hypothetical protein
LIKKPSKGGFFYYSESITVKVGLDIITEPVEFAILSESIDIVVVPGTLS